MELDRPRAVDALYAAGHWLHERERHADAADCFRAMLLLAPNDARGWLGLARSHELAGHDDIAGELYAMLETVQRASDEVAP